MKNHRFFQLLMFFYHTAFAYIAWRILLVKKGDAFGYWFVGQDLSSENWSRYCSLGTGVVKMMTFPMVKYLHLPFWSGFLIFSTISAAGILLLYQMLMNIAGNNKKLQASAMLMLLLPSVHFWTSIPGKESLIFTLLIIFLKYNTGKNPFHAVGLLALFGIAAIRPHFAAMILVAWMISVLFRHRITKNQRLLFAESALLALLLMAVMLSRILVRFEGFATTIGRYYASHIRFFKTTDSYVPLDQYPLPCKLFSFWFRPFPFEESGVLYTAMSTENILLLLLSILAVFFAVRYFKRLKLDSFTLFGWMYILIFSMLYSYGYANYGIISRTKIMILPVFYILVLNILKAFSITKYAFKTPSSPQNTP